MPGIAEAPSSIEFRSSASRWEALIYLFMSGCVVYPIFSKDGSIGVIEGALVALFLLGALYKAIAKPDRSVHLAFDAEGLLAPHVFERKLPWASIRSFRFENEGEGVSKLFVELVDPYNYGPKQTDPLETWPVTSRGFSIVTDRLIGCRDNIEAAFRRFAPSVSKI